MFKKICNGLLHLTIILTLGSVVLPSEIQAQPIRPGFDSYSLARNDDESTGQVGIGFTIDFFGINQNYIYINNNGNVTFTGPASTYVPQGLSGGAYKIIAPYWGDIDTRYGGNAVTYGSGTVDGRSAYGINWVGVRKYPGSNDSTISCQLIFIERGDTGTNNFDFEFNYGAMGWSPGGVGWSNGNYGGNNVYYENVMSYTQLSTSSNCGVSGRFKFTVREGRVVATEVTVTPSTAFLTIPDTLALTASVFPENADQSVSWSSSDTSAASVNSNGVVTAIKPGIVTITATSLATAGLTGTSVITIRSRDNVIFFGTEF